MQIHSVGIDMGKTTFHLVALGAAGKVLVKKKFTQRQLLVYTANMQTSLIGLEACSGAHFLGRALSIQEDKISSSRRCGCHGKRFDTFVTLKRRPACNDNLY